MNKPLFDLDRPGMMATVNSYKPGNGLAWPTLFPLKYSPKFDLKGIEGDEGIPVSADRVAFNAKAPIKSRRKVGSWSGRLAKYAISREKNEIEINEYNDLKTIAAANTEDRAAAQQLVDLVYNDLDFCNSGMDYKVELDSMRIGSSGMQTYSKSIDGDMTTLDVINFNIPAKNFIGVNNKWNDPEKGDGLNDIYNAQELIAKQGLRKPQYAIMERAKFLQLCAQKSTARRLFPRYDQNLVTADMINITNINAYMVVKGWPQILVLDTYTTIQGKDGTETTIKPWNVNTVVLSPTPQLGWTYYKPVPMIGDTSALQVQASYYKLTRYSQLNPMLEVTMAEAYVQPGLINRNSLVYINTQNPKWNNGQE